VLLPASQRTAELPSLLSALGFWANGSEDITPYWQAIKPDGSLNGKVPGGVEAQAGRLMVEGHTIEPGEGKKPPRVKGLEGCLQMPAVVRPTGVEQQG